MPQRPRYQVIGTYRGQIPQISKNAPKTKDNSSVICGWSSTLGNPYIVNPNILLYNSYNNP
jgi:hypothetical protein